MFIFILWLHLFIIRYILDWLVELKRSIIVFHYCIIALSVSKDSLEINSFVLWQWIDSDCHWLPKTLLRKSYCWSPQLFQTISTFIWSFIFSDQINFTLNNVQSFFAIHYVTLIQNPLHHIVHPFLRSTTCYIAKFTLHHRCF